MFDPIYENTFTSFGLQHLMATMVVFSIVALIIVNASKIRQSRHVDAMRIGLASLILLQEVSLNIYRIAVGQWEIGTSLPLHLCGLGVLSSAIVLLTKSETLFRNVFFVMLIGATMALLTPSIEYNLGFPHYRYFQFFTSHGLIVINFTFALFVLNFQKDIRYRHLLNNFFTMALLAIILLPINLLTGGNYMYLMGKPGVGTAFDLFGEHPWYLLNILLFGVPVLFHLFYLPFFVRDHRRRQRALA